MAVDGTTLVSGESRHRDGAVALDYPVVVCGDVEVLERTPGRVINDDTASIGAGRVDAGVLDSRVVGLSEQDRLVTVGASSDADSLQPHRPGVPSGLNAVDGSDAVGVDADLGVGDVDSFGAVLDDDSTGRLPGVADDELAAVDSDAGWEVEPTSGLL